MRIPRRVFLVKAAAGMLGGLAVGRTGVLPAAASTGHSSQHPAPHAGNMTVGDVDLKRLGFDPSRYLRSFDWGKVSTLPNGRTVREYTIIASERDIEIAPGVGRGDVLPGESFTYEFEAIPFGLHLYHCHSMPLKRHIHKGLYGTFIIDPKQGRPPAQEFVMMMNAFDTNFDNENEVYAVNSVAFHYAKHPIQVTRGRLVRIYLVNITEFDPINSIHVHANFFHVFRTGTSRTPSEFTDTIMLCQAERAVL